MKNLKINRVKEEGKQLTWSTDVGCEIEVWGFAIAPQGVASLRGEAAR